MSAVLHFQQNHAGRDFVIGDLHGCFDALRVAMVRHGFDESTDRMFSVGDLVDRGTQSEESIDWIAKPWFHAVRGNHEQMAIGVAAGKHDRDNYLRNGGGWFLALPPARQQLYAEAFDALPYAIDIETDAGLIGIVHAECCGSSWPVFCESLTNPASNTKLRHVTETALWSRCRAADADESIIDGVAALIVGHTPVDHIGALGNVVYIDTGVVFGGKLTMLPLASLTAEQTA